jgi:hypothetical protein
MRATLILIPLMFSSFYSIAEPKNLVCQTSAADEQKRLRKLLDKPNLGDSSKRFFSAIIKGCEGAHFGHKKVFTFDTDGFKNDEKSKIEVIEWSACGKSKTDLVKGKVEATPNLITFKYTSNPLDYFNVERKTLKAGRDTLRDFNCKIEDIDTSENLL